jgi:hypothetical protein
MISAAQPRDRLPSHVMSVPRFERLFRVVAGLDIDKEDLRRYSDFINQKIYDLLVCGEETAKANGRDVIAFIDLPLTKGMRERIREFELIDETIELAPILDHIAARPPLNLRLGEDTESKLPVIAGGLSIALARSFKIIDPEIKNPRTEHWQRAFSIFDLLQ